MSTETDNVCLTLAEIVSHKNVAELLPQKQLDQIGQEAVDGYNTDRRSRVAWEERNEKAIKLALQVQEYKSFPWVNCSNVKFPLLTVAALQFLARISLMTKGRNIAKVEVVGRDPQGRRAAQAGRISEHLSLQLIEEDTNWLDSDEQAKLAAAILGSAFKKTYVDPITGVVISEHIPAMNLVLDYFCKDIDKAERITHVLTMNANAIETRVRQGVFLDVDLEGGDQVEVNILQKASDEAQGLKRPADDESDVDEVLEQLCWLDLDGDDFKEPYILSVHRRTAKVLRIVARFFDAGDVHRVNDAAIRGIESKLHDLKIKMESEEDFTETMREIGRLEREAERLQHDESNKIILINPVEYYTRYLFIPSPDGGVYGLGLGALLSPMNESVNTLVNQLIDAGTMAVTAGGFLGRGVKLKSGNTSFSPFEWKPVDSSGADLKQNIFPLPVREPSSVLFQLLGMLVTYSEKISGATDIMTGVNPGQNTPAETSRNTVEQGMMLFSGIYSRMYRAFKDELRKFFEFNKLYLETSPRWRELTEGEGAILAADDYKSTNFRIFPACSPEAVSKSQKREKAQFVHSLAAQEPGFDRYLATKSLLEAFDVEDIDNLYPDPNGPKAIAPPQNPKVELEKAKLQQQAKEHEDEMKLAIAEMQDQIRLTDAKILELQAKSELHIAQADGVETGHEIAMIEAHIGAAKAHREGLLAAVNTLTKAGEMHGKLHLAAQKQEIEQSRKQQGAIENGNNTAGQNGMGA